VYSAANGIYGRKKAEQGALDFEDLQSKVRELLSRGDLRGRIARRYSYVMVDEFQDTNRLQYEIVLGLLDDLREGNLFIVGDPKQSIYGFRGAEVGVFRDASAGIASKGAPDLAFSHEGKEIPSLPSERRGNIVLPESFRLLPALVEFVNAVF